jgi:hypothetical protein
MDGQIASVAEDNSITVLAFSVVAHSTSGVLSRKVHVGFRHTFHLGIVCWWDRSRGREVCRTRRNHSFSNWSRMTSNISGDTGSACSFRRSILNWASQSKSWKHEFRSEAKCYTANLARPYHTQPDVASRSLKSLQPDFRRAHANRQRDMQRTRVPNVMNGALKVGAITI